MAGMHRLCQKKSHTKHSMPFAIVFSTPIHKISFIQIRLNRVIVENFCSLNLPKCGWLQGNVRGRRSPIPPISALSTVQGVAGDKLRCWRCEPHEFDSIHIIWFCIHSISVRICLLSAGFDRSRISSISCAFTNLWSDLLRFRSQSADRIQLRSIYIRNVRYCLHLRQYSILLNKLSSIFNLNFEWMYTIAHSNTYDPRQN